MVYVFKFMPWIWYMIQSFTKFYISCLHHMSIFTAWYLATYTYKIIFKIFHVLNPAVCFLDFRPGCRPHRSTGPFQARPADRPVDRVLCPGRARLCTSVGRPTENSLLSVFYRSADRPTEPNGYMPTALPVDRTGRPPSLQSPNGSFLFGEILKSVLGLFLWQTFSEFYGLFSDQISLN